jgi:hypothetical protein
MRILTRLTLVLFTLLALFPADGRAGQRTLQNENIMTGQPATIQAGFIAGDIGAAVLEASPGEYPITIQTVQILIADSTGVPGNFRDYIITIYPTGTVNPGSPVYTSGTVSLAANAFTEIDVSSSGIVINSGKFTVGASPASGGSPAEPNLVTDQGVGCISGKNRIRDVNSGLWFDGCSLGITGQLAIRAVVDTAGGGGPAPEVLVVVPQTGPASGGSLVTIFGNNFQSGATASFGGNSGSMVTFLDDNRISVLTPPGTGAVDVEVCNPDLQCDTLAAAYTYETNSVLTHSGPTSLGTLVPLQLQSPGNPSRKYLLLCSRTLAPPGIPLSDPGDSRVFPLNFDFQIFQAQADGSSVFRDFTGRLDGTGHATAGFKIPGLGSIAGLQLHFAYAVINSSSQSGVADLSNVTSFVITP